MTSERANAYGRVMKTLSDIGPSKLHDREQELIRDAADTLFFAEADRDEDAWGALDSMGSLMAQLAEADRLLPETAERLLDDLRGCAPEELLAAAA